MQGNDGVTPVTTVYFCFYVMLPGTVYYNCPILLAPETASSTEVYRAY